MTDSEENSPAFHFAVRRARRERDLAFLMAALSHEIEGHLAADYLGQVGDASVVPALLPLLSSSNPHERASAARALRRLEATSAVPKLVELAKHDDVPWVRTWALESVSRLSGSAQCSVLVAALSDPDWRARQVAVTSLRYVGDASVIDALRIARGRERWYLRRGYAKAMRQILRRQP